MSQAGDITLRPMLEIALQDSCHFLLGRSFLLTGKVFFSYGWSFVAYGQLAWSFFLLTVEIRFGLFNLRFPQSGIRFGLCCLRFLPVQKLGLVFFAYGSPHRK